MKINEAINEARRRRNLTQVQLAKLLNVPQARISEWERGIHTPNAETVTALEKALNVSFVVSFVEL